MAEEETKPEEEKTKPEEKTEPEEETEEIHPDISHHPIDIGAVNLNTLQNQAYQAYLEGIGQPTASGGGAGGPGGPPLIHSGDQLLITLTLAYPVQSGELPYVVDIVYTAVQNSGQKTSGIFLYKQTTAATFVAGLPNNGASVQQFPLQTIKFNQQHKQGGPVDITITLFNGGQEVGDCQFRIHP